MSENQTDWDSDIEVRLPDNKTVRETELVEKAKRKVQRRFCEHIQAIRDNLVSLSNIERLYNRGEYDLMREAYQEIDAESRELLNLAPTKGGWFTVDQRKQLRGE